MKPFLFSLLFALTALAKSAAAEPVFSGPQPRERTTPFKMLEVTGPRAGQERDPVADNHGAPTAFVFLHALERSLVPLLRVIDQYGAERKDRLSTEIIFLAPDRLEGEQRLKAAARSLQLQSHVGLSLDGAEGPGNYGLNKDCMMTIVIAKENTVTANFALVQPGIADAPRVIEALARACGDASPPSVQQLTGRQMARGGSKEGRMQTPAKATEPPRSEALQVSKFDLNSEAGLREAVRELIAEVNRLNGELAELKNRGETSERVNQPKEKFPGAVPTDARLNSLLRQFIRPTNDNTTVDRLLTEIENHIKGNGDLTRQAIDGWTRVLHFGDRYGTAYARQLGQQFLDKLKAAQP